MPVAEAKNMPKRGTSVFPLLHASVCRHFTVCLYIACKRTLSKPSSISGQPLAMQLVYH